LCILGLPEFPNTERFHETWNFVKENSLEYNPITLLSSLLNTLEDALTLHERLKLSAYERDLLYFVTKYKDEAKDIDTLMFGNFSNFKKYKFFNRSYLQILPATVLEQ
jgi:tRNA nucleotidyltransferase (CCA-adding enzyme)